MLPNRFAADVLAGCDEASKLGYVTIDHVRLCPD
jgi:hypothetical protein